MRLLDDIGTSLIGGRPKGLLTSTDIKQKFYTGINIVTLDIVGQVQHNVVQETSEPLNKDHHSTVRKQAASSLQRLPGFWSDDIPAPATDNGRFFKNITISLAYYATLAGSMIALDRFTGPHSAVLLAAAYVVVSGVCAPLHALWTHNMVMQTCIPFAAMSRQLKALTSLASYQSLLLPSAMHAISQLMVLDAAVAGSWTALSLHGGPLEALRFAMRLCTISCLWLAVVPWTYAMLVIVETSLLEDVQSTAVRFDRSVTLAEAARPTQGSVKHVPMNKPPHKHGVYNYYDDRRRHSGL